MDTEFDAKCVDGSIEGTALGGNPMNPSDVRSICCVLSACDLEDPFVVRSVVVFVVRVDVPRELGVDVNVLECEGTSVKTAEEDVDAPCLLVPTLTTSPLVV